MCEDVNSKWETKFVVKGIFLTQCSNFTARKINIINKSMKAIKKLIKQNEDLEHASPYIRVTKKGKAL